jgi:hypothetical protein
MYNKLVEEIGREFKDIPKEQIGTHDSMLRIKIKWDEEKKMLEELREKIIHAYICRSIIDAEKLIFLIDGNAVEKFLENRENEKLTNDFTVYRDIMNLYKGNKKYRLVITKTDGMGNQIEKKFYKKRRNVKGVEVEKWLLGELEKGIPAFKGIVGRAKTVDAKLYSVCLETYKDELGKPKPIVSPEYPGGIALWNYDDFIKGIL